MVEHAALATSSHMHTRLLLTAAAFAALTSCTPSGVSVDSTNAATTTESILSGLAQDQPVVVWKAMSETQQNDLQSVVGELAAAMDPQVYDRSFGIFRKVVQIAKTKRSFVLGNAQVQSTDGFDLDAARADWDRVVKVLETVAESDLKTLDGLRGLQLETFLATTGASVMGQLHQLAALSTEAEWPAFTSFGVEDLGDGRVRVTSPDRESNEMAFVEVEERWIPEDMNKSWGMVVAQMRKGIRELDMSKDRAKTLQMLGAIDGTLDGLLAANSQEEFDETLGNMMAAAFGFGAQPR